MKIAKYKEIKKPYIGLLGDLLEKEKIEKEDLRK